MEKRKPAEARLSASRAPVGRGVALGALSAARVALHELAEVSLLDLGQGSGAGLGDLPQGEAGGARRGGRRLPERGGLRLRVRRARGAVPAEGLELECHGLAQDLELVRHDPLQGAPASAPVGANSGGGRGNGRGLHDLRTRRGRREPAREELRQPPQVRQLAEELAHGEADTVGALDPAHGLDHRDRIRSHLQEGSVRAELLGASVQYLGHERHQLGKQIAVGGRERDDRRRRRRLHGCWLLQGEASALEGIGRQEDPVRSAPRIDGAPVDRRAPRPEGAQAREQDLRAPLGLQAGQPGHVLTGGREVPGQADKRGLRTDLHDSVAAGSPEALHRLLEPDRRQDLPAPVPGPVSGLGHLAATGLAGDRRDHRHDRPLVGDRRGDLAEGLGHRRHQGGVEGMGDLQLAVLEAPGLQRGEGLPQAPEISREDDLRGSVDGGHGQPPGPERGRRLGLGHGGEQRGHAPPGRQGFHPAPPLQREHHSVFGGERPGHASGRDLPDAVAQHHRRRDPPGAPELRERDLEGEQGGLGLGRPVDPRRPFSVEHVEKGALPVPPVDRIEAPQRAGKDGLRLVELAAHARVLRALAREDEGDPGSAAAGGFPRGPRLLQ